MLELLPTEDERFERATKDLLEGIFKKPIEQIREDAKHQELETMTNIEVARKMLNCQRILKRILDDAGCEAEVDYAKTHPLSTYGAINVEGVTVEVLNTGIFARAADSCDNVEVYALANGKVRLSYCFYDASVEIK